MVCFTAFDDWKQPCVDKKTHVSSSASMPSSGVDLQLVDVIHITFYTKNEIRNMLFQHTVPKPAEEHAVARRMYCLVTSNHK